MELTLARPSLSLCAAADAFGPRMHAPLQAFRSVLKAASDLHSASPPTAALLRPLHNHLDVLDDLVAALPRSDILLHHISLLAIAADALACVAAPTPLEYVHTATEKAATHIANLTNMTHHPTHPAFARQVQNFLDILTEYVCNNLQAPLVIVEQPPSPASAPAALPSPSPPATSASSSARPRPDTSTHTAPHLVHFRNDILSKSVSDLERASNALGGVVAEQARALCSAMTASYDYMVDACTMPAAPPDEQAETIYAPVLKHMKRVDKLTADAQPNSPTYNHIKAVDEAMISISWLAAPEDPLMFITDAEETASFFLNKLLIATKNDPEADKHKQFVNSLRAFFKDTAAYVKKYHMNGLRYNCGVEAKGGTDITSVPVPVTADDGDSAESYVTAFKVLIDGPLASFVQASNTIGAEVAEQAAAFAGAWEAEAEFLCKAINMPKPDDIQDLLAPIAAKMDQVAAVVEKVDPRGPLAQHCNALGESVAALGWVAVDEKATAYVGDMAGAGQFFIDKVKMGAKKTQNPDAHRTWANALESLFAGLKSYVKEYHTQKLVWNPPKVANVAKKSVASGGDNDDEVGASNYVSAFKEIIDGPLDVFIQASNKIGGEVAEQAAAFAGAWKAETDFLSKAINMPKPDDIQDMLAPIATKMGEVGTIVERVDPRGPLAQHCNAVGESVAALGWVAIDEKATGYVGDMAGAGQFFVDKVKMGAKKTDNPEMHRAWAKALEALFGDLKAYVKEYHTERLVWNPPNATRATKNVLSPSDDIGPAASDYVTAFNEVISGSLAPFVQASTVIGGEVAVQAIAFADAWKAEADFLAKAINMPKPDSVQDMLAPIAGKMGEVGAIAEKVDPRGPLAQHCNALGESVAALGWVAVDENATSYVADMTGTGQFFIDKVKMGAKKTGNPEAHRTWAKALETLFGDLKSYVKEYHTQKLVWNPPKAAQAKRNIATIDQDNSAASSVDYVTAFKNLIDGPLATFVAASNILGGEVADQATAFSGAWEAEAQFLRKAISMPKPDDIQDILAPIAAKMGAVGEVAQQVDPRGPFAQHCNALGESVAALGWVAVDEKATGFVGDMVGAGQFFLDKVKMGAKKTNNPEAHRTWANSLEALFAELKAYVKQYHTQKLVWNCIEPADGGKSIN